VKKNCSFPFSRTGSAVLIAPKDMLVGFRPESLLADHFWGYLWGRTDDQEACHSQAARACCRMSVTNTSKSVPFTPSQHAPHCVGLPPVLPETRAPRGDVSPHGGDDIGT
jgi:hypothetical protein